jgi:hypothetical protein
MRNWILLLLVAFIGTIGCDVIENPIKDIGSQPPPDTTNKVVRKIVIEDYTGHRWHRQNRAPRCGTAQGARRRNPHCVTHVMPGVRMARLEYLGCST